MTSRLDAETHLLLTDSALDDAQREAVRQRAAWRAGAGDADELAAAEARLRLVAEARLQALAQWRMF